MAPKPADDLAVGGQAVPGGVAILGGDRHVTAVRASTGLIETRVTRVASPPPALTRIPVLRGVVALGRSLRLGVGSIRWAISVTAPDPVVGSRAGMAATTLVAAVVAASLFVLLPAGLAAALTESAGAGRLAVEAVARVAAFLGYVFAVSVLASVREVFRYHGAEHRAVAAYEAGVPLTVEAARHLPVRHPRCGTNFTMLVVLLSTVVFAFVPHTTLASDLAARMLLLPLVVGLTYEVQRVAARRTDRRLSRMVLWPGLALQRLTTAEPDERELEVALVAVRLATGTDVPALPAPGAAPIEQLLVRAPTPV